MALTTFSAEPFNDDFDEKNKFYRILFRPSLAVQARELTQLQTILQNQIQYQGNHLFKEGAMVIPGQISIDTNFCYVKLQPLYNGNVIETYVRNIEDTILVGSSGLRAQVIHVAMSTETEETTVYVRYLNSATDSTTKVFADGEVLIPENSPSFTVQAIASAATGIGSAVQIQRGVYYVKGNFVLCDKQTLILDKYTNTPSYRVGLSVIEKVITPEDTGYEMLLDNAQSSFNFAAPGAHRYFIDLILTKIDLDSTDDTDFVELMQVDQGKLKKEIRTTQYSVLEETLARRTFDESGNYTVRPFRIDVREHRDNNRGVWTSNTAYQIGDVVLGTIGFYVARNTASSVNTPPTHSTGLAYDGPGSTGVQWEFTEKPSLNRGIYKPEDGGDESLLAVGMEPGKAYVQGYEIEKIATEYIPVAKARDYVNSANSYINATVGNYVLVTNVTGVPNISSFEQVDIYDKFYGAGLAVAGTKIGTARVRGIEWHSGNVPGSSTDISTSTYKLFLFDIKLNAGKSFDIHAKTFNRVAGGGKSQFLCTIDPIRIPLTGSVSSSATDVTGNGTSFQTDLSLTDVIEIDGNVRNIATISGQQALTTDVATTATNVPVYVLRTTILEPQGESILYGFPQAYVRSMRTIEGLNDTSYTVSAQFSGTSSAESGGECTLVISTTSGTFASSAETDNYLVIKDSNGEIVQPLGIVASGTSATLTFDSDYAITAFTVIATINKAGTLGTEKTKSLATGTVTFTTLATATAASLSLGKADIYRIKSIKMADTFGAGTYSIDISDRYSLDDGQRSTHYDIGKLNLLPSFAAPSGSVQVIFEYFTHSTGDYFTVNSYPSSVQYSNIPYFNNVPLRDVIDFRPRIADTGTAFTGSGSSTSLLLKRGIDILTDFSYYLPRKDKIAIDFAGKFYDLEGIPSLNAKYPMDQALGMTLYSLDIEPFTFNPASVKYVMTDNKRYTMRDIGKLDKRIDNLEYYTSLSLLEQETSAISLRDENGLDRFKNGFIVDGFSGHNTGNIFDPDYLCSIDMERGELRPFFNMDNVNLIESASNDTQRLASNYQATGALITLPIAARKKLVEQQYASRIENINPFAIFTFLGSMNIIPSTDEWFEVDRRPDIIQNVEGNFNTIASLAEKAGVLGSVWNAWQTQWTGTPYVSSTTQVNYNAHSDQMQTIVDGRVVYSGQRDAGNFGSTTRNDGFKMDAGTVAHYLAAEGQNSGYGRNITLQTVATQVGQSRSGVKTTIVAKIDHETVDDRVVSTAILPYCRERNILVQAKGLKPNTKFNLFFDGIDLNETCTASSFLTYTLTGTKNFDHKSPAGGQASEAARTIEFNSYFNNSDLDITDYGYGFNSVYGKNVDNIKSTTTVCLSIGDVITGQTSGATAVIVGEDYNTETDVKRLHVQNMEGVFTVGETFVGSLSGATGVYQSLEYVYGNSSAANKYNGVAGITVSNSNFMVTNQNGELNFIFTIPNRADSFLGNTAGMRFRTGIKEVKLVDVGTVDGAFTSQSRSNYIASGVLQTKQATIVATRNAELVQEPIQDNRVIVNSSERVVADTGWYDPIAQTFMVDCMGGCLVTDIDVFFATKDSAIPVSLEIREVVNGYPGKRVLPFSKVTLKPESVRLSATSVQLPDGRTFPSYDTATNFKFESPVYLMNNTEYCIVLMSDSDKYNVWISQMGDKIPASNRTISEQPYMGSFFKSQNASTWTADQSQDLKFTIWRASFDTSIVSNVEFVNDNVSFSLLETNPVETVTGQAKVRIWHKNHGMSVGSKVVIRSDNPADTFGVRGVGTITSSLASSSVTGVGVDFNATLEVGSVLFNSAGTYVGTVNEITSSTTLTLTENAAVAISNGAWSYTMSVGGIPSNVFFATHTIGDVDPGSYTIIMPVNATKSGYFGGSSVRASKNVLFDAIQPYVQMQEFPDTATSFSVKTVSGTSADGTQTPYSIDAGYSAIVPNDTNEFYTPRLIASPVNETTFLSGTKSLKLSVAMSTNNEAISPILDTSRLSAIAVSNLINNPVETNTNVAELDIKEIHSGTGLTFAAPGTITVASGSVANFQSVSIGKYLTISGNSASNNNGTYLIENIEVVGTTIVLTMRAAAFTSASSVSGTKVSIRSLFASDIAPSGSSTISNYVTRKISFANPSTSLHVMFAANIPIEANVKVFYKTLPIGSSQNISSIPYTEIDNGRVLPKSSDYNAFTDLSFELTDIASFGSVVVKIVMTSTNTSQVPRIKDLRTLACA